MVYVPAAINAETLVVKVDYNKENLVMSTATIFFPENEIIDIVEDSIDNDYLSVFGIDDDKYGLCPYISFYIYHDKSEAMAVAKKVVDIFQEFETLIDEPFKKKYKTKTQVWLGVNDSRLPADLLVEAEDAFKRRKNLWFGATDIKATTATPRWSIAGVVERDPSLNYTTLKMVFRHKWYNQNKATWHQFVDTCVERLQPEQCYSGFEVNSGPLGVMGNYEAETMERTLADYFYGMDIDHHLSNGYHSHESKNGVFLPNELGTGLRTPTWCFMLSPYWLNKLGKTETELRDELDDPRITITAYPYPKNAHNPEGINGLWIQLGELDLHPVAKGKPKLLVMANDLIKPIRCDQLKLTSLDAWDDDPNPRFDHFSGINWMRRFDEDQNWLNHRCPDSPLPPGIYEVKPGQSVPKSGVWSALNEPELAERHLEAGQQVPLKPNVNAEGEPILWRRQLDAE